MFDISRRLEALQKFENLTVCVLFALGVFLLLSTQTFLVKLVELRVGFLEILLL